MKSYPSYCCVFPLILLIRNRQRKNKFGTDAHCADHINMFTMRHNDLFCDGKAEAGALFIFAAGQVGLIEAVPDQL